MDIKSNNNKSIINIDLSTGKHQVTLNHPTGTFALTPASNTIIQAIIKNYNLLSGIGIDWGSGVGCLAIIASKSSNIEKIYGLEISKADVDISFENALINNVSEKTHFMLSDSYTPFSENDKFTLKQIETKVDFILSNPPSSEGDDGFGFRREVLRGAKKYLKHNGIVFLNISFQYGRARLEQLIKEVDGYAYKGLLYSTECVPFDLTRPDLLHCLKLYAQQEKNGDLEYTFINPESPQAGYINAQAALNYYKATGRSPLTKWQTHLFEYIY
jgi:hypothetical protein